MGGGYVAKATTKRNEASGPPLPVDAAKVKEWLRGQGYPLEMSTALECVRAGLHVVRSEYYVDPVTQKSREIDVVAWRQGPVVTDGRASAVVRVKLVIECKSGQEGPWVVFTVRDRLSNRAFIAQQPSNKLGGKILTALASHSQAHSWPLFRLPPKIGYGGVLAMKSKGENDAVYAAVAGVSTATSAMLLGQPARIRLAEVIFPVVVTAAPLFEAYMDKGNDIVVEAVDSTVIAWRNPMVGQPHTIVRLVTASAFNGFVREADMTFRSILAAAVPAGRASRTIADANGDT